MIQRAAPLYEVAVAEAVSTLTVELNDLGVEIVSKRKATEIVQVVVRSYLAVARDLETRRVSKKSSPLLKSLVLMPVGETRIIEDQHTSTLKSKLRVAAAHMGQLDASFRVWRKDGKLYVKRVANGTRSRDPNRNPKAVELASLVPGQSVIAKTIRSTRGKGQMGQNTQVQARRILDDKDAKWSVKATAEGILLTRVC